MPVITQCDYCNKSVKRKPSDILSHVFCSKKCSSKDLVRRTRNSRKTTCKQCGKTFYPHKRCNRKDQQFCDQKCMGAFNATLDYSISHLSKETLENIDGFLLGDGHISPNNPHLTWSLKYKDFSDYTLNTFSCYDTISQYAFFKNKKLKNGGRWQYHGRSKTHPDLKKQRKRWYPDGLKIVPEDVIITPKSVLFWYLGDGGLRGVNIELCTDCFDERGLDILIEKLQKVEICATKHKRSRLRIRLGSIRNFFNLIGWKSPVKCYNYKFNIPTVIRNCESTAEIARDFNLPHHMIYNSAMRWLKYKKQPSVNNSFWWTKKEKNCIKNVLISKGILSQQGK